jgi:hypothetical protein
VGKRATNHAATDQCDFLTRHLTSPFACNPFFLWGPACCNAKAALS